MADLVSSLAKMQNAEIESGSIETEILNQRIGANINGLIDQTDTNEASLVVIEDKGQVAGVEGSQDILSGNTLVAASTTIIPAGVNVLIMPSGGVFNPETEDDFSDVVGDNSEITSAELVLKKNGVSILSVNFNLDGMLNFSGLTFLDTAATAGASNTYSLEVTNNTTATTGTGTLRTLNAKIDLLEF